ncbi:predicted protein [Nematostella vectensis]|uniref:Adenosine deaminase n=1 Tax=Nematostella vectensis TaxID=45351 RepID=A7RSR8_NEMVE|nr:adenosine deaminase [Nematostella vectensis]EDO45463.1 predicted protein [Nematostella vectensis]|eukprot:XP_001637526.1 predicted protein [Nematostella vectensis]
MSLKHIAKSKVELHVHLDGALRISTIIDLARKKNIKLPTYDETKLRDYVSVSLKHPSSLRKFLQCFGVFIKTIVGDLNAIERIAYEFCEDQARNGVIYFEARYSPHILATEDVTPDEVVEAVNQGFLRGQVDFRVVARSILCCMRHEPDWSLEVVELCEKFKEAGVVGIDLAGDESLGETPATKNHVMAFEEARRVGIHRTVHAGEAGPAASVREALDQLHAERIGHGYHTLEDEELYDRVLKERIHLETCPTSSILTGAVPPPFKCHPILKFARDGANFSLNSDDPLVCDTTIENEYRVAHDEIGLGEEDFKKATLNAAKASFLPDYEKLELIKHLEKIHRMQGTDNMPSDDLDGLYPTILITPN